MQFQISVQGTYFKISSLNSANKTHQRKAAALKQEFWNHWRATILFLWSYI